MSLESNDNFMTFFKVESLDMWNISVILAKIQKQEINKMSDSIFKGERINLHNIAYVTPSEVVLIDNREIPIESVKRMIETGEIFSGEASDFIINFFLSL